MPFLINDLRVVETMGSIPITRSIGSSLTPKTCHNPLILPGQRVFLCPPAVSDHFPMKIPLASQNGLLASGTKFEFSTHSSGRCGRWPRQILRLPAMSLLANNV